MSGRLDVRLVDLGVETTSPAYLTDAAAFEPYVREPTNPLYVYRETDDGGAAVEVDELEDLARTDWQLLGFALTEQYDLAAFDREVAVGVEHVLAETPLTAADFPLSFFKLIAVAPGRRGEGIGSELGARAVSPCSRTPGRRDGVAPRRPVEPEARRAVRPQQGRDVP